MNDNTANTTTDNTEKTQQNHSAQDSQQHETSTNTNPEPEKRCGHKHPYGPQHCSHADWQHWKQYRWKKIAAVIGLVFLGFFIGKVTSHHHGHPGYGHHGYYQQAPMMHMPYQAAPMPYYQQPAPVAPMQPNVQR
ncbi:hypothetical protein [Thiolinea disciformis]|uniref:hypothetical protein n=1 Tax=Thiolinea disciformis TaxID=125614 RepID=UPI00035C6123|nr:hypothetical protein [Thiolinea disciformis]